MKKYVIGVDYGTLSARALLVDTGSGRELATAEFAYPHAVLPQTFFEGIRLPSDTALQHPRDYLDALSVTVKSVLEKAKVDPNDVAGIGFDFTSCTVLPVLEDGTPLCFLEQYKNEPHAYAKLWKHHSAQAEADEITDLAEKENAPWLQSYGGKVSSEWLFPKLLEVLHKAPEVYENTARFVEAGDWLTWLLTGVESHSSCMAGYKGLWNKKTGYPSNEFWGKLHPDFGNIIGTKISQKVLPTGTKAGEITLYGAELTGLAVGTTVAAPIIDAHAALPAAGVVDAGTLMLIIGTSSCHIVMSQEEKTVRGICGTVEDGVIPGLVAYEAGQTGVGDSFDWFVKRCVPESYEEEAREKGVSIFSLLDEKAARYQVGESGVLALDWLNGNRTPYADYDLTGLILGISLATPPEAIYRALLEATAFGTKAIVDLYEENGVAISALCAAGGIAKKNPFLMQMYADVLGKPISVAASTQAGAKGSAVFASVAGGCFKSVQEAAKVIADESDISYTPNLENTAKYAKLYEEYKTLSSYFAKENPVMKKLKQGL